MLDHVADQIGRERTAMATRGARSDHPVRIDAASLGMLAVATAIGSMGLAAGGVAGAILGSEMAGTRAAAGLPPGLLVVGSAVAALLVSRRSGRAGRARGLTLGYLVGALGAALVIAAATAGSLGGLLLGSALLGAANASIFLTRYAAADLGGEAARGRALGIVLFATAIGAVASPNLLGPSGDVAQAMGLPPLTGLYLIAVVAFAAAALILTALPAPRLAASDRRVDLLSAHHGEQVAPGDILSVLKPHPARTALILLATANLVMVAVMTVVPVHLMSHGHGLTVIGAGVSIHVAGMFVPSPLSGWLADRVGPTTVGAVGVALLVVVGVAGVLIPEHGAAPIVVVLAVLGVGWNFGVVGASTQLAVSVPPALRPHVEGIGEGAMGFAAAVGAPLAGGVVALGGLTALWPMGAAVAGLALVLVWHAGPAFRLIGRQRTRPRHA